MGGNTDKENKSEVGSEKERKRRIAASAVALVTSASVLVGGLFQSPAALLEDEEPSPVVIYQEDEDDLLGGGDGDGDGQEKHPETSETAAAALEEPGIKAGLRQWILRLPYGVRLLVILPLWALGWLILTTASALWTAVLSPVLGKALAWLLLLAALLGAFVLAAKTVFPDLPVKKILNKRSVLGLVIGSALLGVADILVPLFWDGYGRVEAIVRGVGTLLVFGTATLSFLLREKRRRRARQEEAAVPPTPEAEKPLTRREILALADSAKDS